MALIFAQSHPVCLLPEQHLLCSRQARHDQANRAAFGRPDVNAVLRYRRF